MLTPEPEPAPRRDHDIAPLPVPVPPAAAVAAPVLPPPRQEPAPEPVVRGPPHILVAAVNAMNRKIIEQILIGARYVPHLVANGDQALDAIEARPIDLLLLDLGAAAEDDAATAEQCRDASPGLPIVVLSGDPEAASVLAEIGVDAVLSKPLEPSRLLAAIKAAVPAPPALPTPLPAAEAVVTEISSHPRFGRGHPPMIDRRAVDALWSLGGGGAFFDGVIEAFRIDARQILKDLAAAAATGDAGAFSAGVQALRNCTASFGGAPLREMLLSMQQISSRELRDQGADYVQELSAEIARIDEVLVDYRKTAE